MLSVRVFCCHVSLLMCCVYVTVCIGNAVIVFGVVIVSVSMLFVLC